MHIKGEYWVNIQIQNMFHTYNIRINHHNLVTNQGVELIMKCATNTNNENEWFGSVHTGKNNTPPTREDTVETFNTTGLPNENGELTTPKPTIEKNTLTYNISTDGSFIDGTSEIGVWSKDKKTLISRDVHETWSVPTGSIINIKYMFTINND